jgi:hypothetical protein
MSRKARIRNRPRAVEAAASNSAGALSSLKKGSAMTPFLYCPMEILLLSLDTVEIPDNLL